MPTDLREMSDTAVRIVAAFCIGNVASNASIQHSSQDQTQVVEFAVVTTGRQPIQLRATIRENELVHLWVDPGPQDPNGSRFDFRVYNRNVDLWECYHLILESPAGWLICEGFYLLGISRDFLDDEKHFSSHELVELFLHYEEAMRHLTVERGQVTIVRANNFGQRV